MKIGSVILYKNGTGIYAKLQHWFSGFPYNHVAIYCGKDGLDQDEVISANLTIGKEFLDVNNPNIEIYEPLFFSEELLKEVLKQERRTSEGWIYAFLQILYFVRRKLYESIPFLWKVRQFLFKKTTIKRLNNWFPRSLICTEYFYNYYKNVALAEPDKVARLNLLIQLNQYDGNNLYVSDVREILEHLSIYFVRIK